MSQPVREGSRWRFVKPSPDEVAEWFQTVPLDEGMRHEDFVSGVVIIPASEKVKTQVRRNDGSLATAEQYEMTFTPYVRVDTRVSYFRRLAELREQIAVIEPVYVPTINEGAARNDNMPPGFWWHVVPGDRESRFVCCTMRVALYDREAWTREPESVSNPAGERLTYQAPRALREGTATKQVPTAFGSGRVDENMLLKAETGAVGRALGMAGILIVGTGIATAEDLAELRESASVELPHLERQDETPEELNARLVNLQATLTAEAPAVWAEIAEWWKTRCAAEGWDKLEDAPIEVRRGMATRMSDRLLKAREDSNSSSDAPDAPADVEVVSSK